MTPFQVRRRNSWAESHVERDFAQVNQQIGVSASPPHLPRPNHRPYRDYYDDEARDLVAHHCRRDVEAFGYEY